MKSVRNQTKATEESINFFYFWSLIKLEVIWSIVPTATQLVNSEHIWPWISPGGWLRQDRLRIKSLFLPLIPLDEGSSSKEWVLGRIRGEDKKLVYARSASLVVIRQLPYAFISKGWVWTKISDHVRITRSNRLKSNWFMLLLPT